MGVRDLVVQGGSRSCFEDIKSGFFANIYIWVVLTFSVFKKVKPGGGGGFGGLRLKIGTRSDNKKFSFCP